MATSDKQGGTLRTDYETDRARLDNFPAQESNWQELLLRLMNDAGSIRYCDDGREGTLRNQWVDHVLTVLVEINCTSTSDESFVEMYGTNAQAKLAEKLKQKAKEWIIRLNNYIKKSWQAGLVENPAVQTANLLEEQLKNALSGIDKIEKRSYFRLIRAVNDIHNHFDFHLKQIEESGDMDAALALLLIYLRGYGNIAQTFNNRFATLPELYRHDLLHAKPHGAVADNTYVGITPTEGTPGFTLPAGQSFAAGQNAAGEELIYQTGRQEYISPMRCAEVNAVYISREGKTATGIRKQTIRFGEASTAEVLFDNKCSQPLSLGWMLESSMFVLGEGNRKVRIDFRLTNSMLPSDTPLSEYFSLQISHAKGWKTLADSICQIKTVTDGLHLHFEFTLYKEQTIPVPCVEELHGATTEYPALRIRTATAICSYDWASHTHFDTLSIRTEVTGVRNFTFYNELGQIETQQPFPPFGIQAGKDAWFLFGNKEMGLKPLEMVSLTGKWKKLPETEEEFNHIYKGYTTEGKNIDVNSFTITTQYQQAGQWHDCKEKERPLFLLFDKEYKRSLTDAKIIFHLPPKGEQKQSESGVDPELEPDSDSNEYSRDRDGFFRVMLKTPSIGFGTDTYRTLFTQIMIDNSLCKKKERKELPAEPLLPMLADVELSYTAFEKTTVAEIDSSTIRLSRITPLSESATSPLDKKGEQPFLPIFPADHLLYFAFTYALGEDTIRIYIDLILPEEKLLFYNPQSEQPVKIGWEYWSGNEWKTITIIRADETRGLTQSGFVELKLPAKITDNQIDHQGHTWIRAKLAGNVSTCLAVRSIRTNYIRLTSQNGDGTSLPAGTIQNISGVNDRIENILQPLPGFGGKPAETEAQSAIHQSARISNRHRAVTTRDYEQLILEYFPEVDKVQCLTLPSAKGVSEVCLVIFSRAEDKRYCLSPAWKLTEIQRFIQPHTSPFVPVRVINPVYEQVRVYCKAVLWDNVEETDRVIRSLVVLAQNYLAPWYRKGEIPTIKQSYSYKELHSRMVNHEDLMKLVSLEVNGKGLSFDEIRDKDIDILIRGSHPWSTLLPKVEIKLLSPHDGINAAEIGNNFIIG